MEVLIRLLVFVSGLALVVGTIFSAISTFVLPRSARSWLTQIVFGILRKLFAGIMKFARNFEQKDRVLAYFAPIGLLLLVPAWYVLIALGYSGMYWALGVGDLVTSFRLSGSSLLTLGFATADNFLLNFFMFSEATLGLIMVALLIAYLPTMYAAFSTREEAVNLLEVRAGSPPSSVEMLLRFNRISGLDNLNEYWPTWESWFTALEESHSTLPALVFFRSPRPENSWITAAGTILDAAALSLSVIDRPFDPAAALSLRAGYLALHRIADYFGIPHPNEPQFPTTPISISQEEFEEVLDQLADANIPIISNRQRAWRDFAGWRVNYDHNLLELCTLVMAPPAFWSSDRLP
jgi:hypothetical protein